jgi:hypothetical protein
MGDDGGCERVGDDGSDGSGGSEIESDGVGRTGVSRPTGRSSKSSS